VSSSDRRKPLMKRAKVKREYSSSYTDAIRFKDEDEVIVEDRQSEWEGWIWCRRSDGIARWVPESYVERDNMTGTMRRDYSARELTIAVGDELIILEEECGWVWCRNGQNELGWVLIENIDILPE